MIFGNYKGVLKKDWMVKVIFFKDNDTSPANKPTKALKISTKFFWEIFLYLHFKNLDRNVLDSGMV